MRFESISVDLEELVTMHSDDAFDFFGINMIEEIGDEDEEEEIGVLYAM